MPDLDLREWTAYGNFVGVNAGDESESLFRVGDPDNAQAAAADHNALVAEVWSLRDELAREPVRAGIEYDHWREAAIANRNQADALAGKLVEVERERDELQHGAAAFVADRIAPMQAQRDAAEARLAAAEQQLLAIDRLHPYYVAAGVKWCSTCKATRWPCPTISTRPGALDAEVTDR